MRPVRPSAPWRQAMPCTLPVVTGVGPSEIQASTTWGTMPVPSGVILRIRSGNAARNACSLEWAANRMNVPEEPWPAR